MDQEPAQRHRDLALAAAFLLLLLFLTPLVRLWAGGQAPWYLPYLVWLAVLLPPAAGGLAARRRRRRP